MRITDFVLIERPVEVVFDFAADQRNEPSYNPAMVRCEKVTSGPIGSGTTFRSALRTRRGEVTMSSEVLSYDRPHSVTTRTAMPGAVVTGTLAFAAESATTTRMTWDWELRPSTAWARLLAPVLGPVGRRFERRIWRGLRDRLESTA
ncbi:MAG: SRPBCC family protein [Actinomycetales bacterium]